MYVDQLAGIPFTVPLVTHISFHLKTHLFLLAFNITRMRALNAHWFFFDFELHKSRNYLLICYWPRQHVGNVDASVRFHSNLCTERPLTLIFCTYMGHDHSSPGIEGQGQSSKSDLKSQGQTSNAVGLRSIFHRAQFSSCSRSISQSTGKF